MSDRAHRATALGRPFHSPVFSSFFAPVRSCNDAAIQATVTVLRQSQRAQMICYVSAERRSSPALERSLLTLHPHV